MKTNNNHFPKRKNSKVWQKEVIKIQKDNEVTNAIFAIEMWSRKLSFPTSALTCKTEQTTGIE